MITLVIPKKKYKGLTGTKKNHKCVLMDSGAFEYQIPTEHTKFCRKISIGKEPTMEIKFDEKALESGGGVNLRQALTLIKHADRDHEFVVNLKSSDETEMEY